jgi:hypothetical protein
MEDVLEVYHLPYNPKVPVICMDESNKQLVGEVCQPILCQPGEPMRVDHEYTRNGVADIFVAVEPLLGKRFVNITERRTMIDWAHFIKDVIDIQYPDAEKVILIMDNLNTHSVGSFYEAFTPEEAIRLSKRLEIHYTPKHGSWLNIAEIELSALTSQCLDRRIPDFDTMRREVSAWQNDRNNRRIKIDWQFSTTEARIKLRRLYPVISDGTEY